jgi:hypothetical protein
MSETILARYQVLDGAVGFLTASGLAPATLMPAGGHQSATLSFWAEQVEGGGGGPLVSVGGPNATQARVSLASRPDAAADVELRDDTWAIDPSQDDTTSPWLPNRAVHWALVWDAPASALRVYRGGVLLCTQNLATWTPRTIAASLLKFYFDAPNGARGCWFANIHVHAAALSAANIADLAAAGPRWNIRVPFGGWPGFNPGVVAWEEEADALGRIANTGTGGPCYLQLAPNVRSVRPPVYAISRYDLVLDEHGVARDLAQEATPEQKAWLAETGGCWSYSDSGTPPLGGGEAKNPLAPGPATLLFWYRQDVAGEGSVVLHSPVELTASLSGGQLVLSLYETPGSAHALNAWHLIAITADGSQLRLYVDGVLDVTVNASDWLDGRISFGNSADSNGLPPPDTVVFYPRHEFARLAVFQRVLAPAELLELVGASVFRDLRRPFGAWAGETPLGYWVDRPVRSRVRNRGLADVRRRQPPRATYPPRRTYLRTPGTSGSFWGMHDAELVAGLFFPRGGGVGAATLRFWVRRPLAPVHDTGTFAEILAGNASLSVGLVDGESLDLVISDGLYSGNSGGLATTALMSASWHAVTVVSDPVANQVRVAVDGVVSPPISTAGLARPPANYYTQYDVAFGSKLAPGEEMDADFACIDVWDEALTAEQIAALWRAGWGFDARRDNADIGWYPRAGVPGTGHPAFSWPGPASPGGMAVPGATVPRPDVWPVTTAPPLVARGSASSHAFASEFRAWAASTHRIAAYSSSWWNEAAMDPGLWSLTVSDPAEYERVFGEIPRVCRVAMDGYGVVWLDVDAALQARVSYRLSTPPDAVGQDDNPLELHAAAPVRVNKADDIPALLDIDAPLRSGFRLAPSRDYAMAGELATVEKMIWAALLTPRGGYDWSPAFGTRLRWKRLRDEDIRAEQRRIEAMVRAVPYVKACHASLLFEQDEVVIDLRVETDFGPFYARRTVGHAA